MKSGGYSSKASVFTGFSKYQRIKSAGKSLGRRTIPARQGFRDIPDIETRPADSTFGHWEADLIHGHNRSGYILSVMEVLVERDLRDVLTFVWQYAAKKFPLLGLFLGFDFKVY